MARTGLESRPIAAQQQQADDIGPPSRGLFCVCTFMERPTGNGVAQAVAENNQSNSNGRGGKRPGAGRKPGSATAKTREIADKAAEEGITPLEYMLQIMRRDSDHADEKIQLAREAMRFEAAKAAAPYIHPRLASVEHSGENGGPIQLGVTLEIVGVPAQG